MTVKDLASVLENYDQDAVVCVELYEGGLERLESPLVHTRQEEVATTTSLPNCVEKEPDVKKSLTVYLR